MGRAPFEARRSPRAHESGEVYFETTQAVGEASHLVAAGGNMKRFPILVIAVLSVVLAQSGLAQSNGSPNNSDPSIQTKQHKKVEKSKVKASKATSKSQSGDKGKKATSSQDAAYAQAYKSGAVKQP
jgi:hypothetical protein